MIEKDRISGRVVCVPQRIGESTCFLLQATCRMFRVIRTDFFWQKRDILFLSPGQLVQVIGMTLPDDRFLAGRILILDIGKEERYHGDPGK